MVALCIKRYNIPNGIKWIQDNILTYLPLLSFGLPRPGLARRAGVLAEAPLVRSWRSTWNTGFCLELAESKDRPRVAGAEAMAARRPQAPTLPLEADAGARSRAPQGPLYRPSVARGSPLRRGKGRPAVSALRVPRLLRIDSGASRCVVVGLYFRCAFWFACSGPLGVA